MFSSCEKCGAKVKAGESICIRCLNEGIEPKLNLICQCGRKGRSIENDRYVSDGTYCFWCFQKKKNSAFNSTSGEFLKKIHPKLAAYYKLQVDQQIAKFYGEPFDERWLQKAWDEIPENERFI